MATFEWEVEVIAVMGMQSGRVPLVLRVRVVECGFVDYPGHLGLNTPLDTNVRRDQQSPMRLK